MPNTRRNHFIFLIIMKELFALLKVILAFPLFSALWVLCPSKSKLLPEKDIDSWRKWKRVKPSSHLLAGAMLFAMFPEFRTQYYFRVGKLSHLFSWIIKGETNLYINTKQIGGGFLIQHGFATIITADRIGSNCKILQQVTVGYNGDKCPIIGNNVLICAGAKVIGGVTIGDNCIIGANAVVVKDVPSGSIVGGIPAKVIKHIDLVDNTK